MQKLRRADRSGTRVDHLGHTVFLIEYGGFRLLLDPVLVGYGLNFRDPPFPTWSWQPALTPDAVIISHGHDDHFHPPSLLGLLQETPIYYFDEDPSHCSCCELPSTRLARLGFSSTFPIREGDRVSLADGSIAVDIIPAEPSCEGEEQCALLIHTPDAVIFDGVDVRDSQDMRTAMEAHRGRVDLAFLPVAASVQWQGFWNQMDAVEAIAFVEWLRPQAVAPCGGALSLGAPPTTARAERYPIDLAAWLSISAGQLSETVAIRERTPFYALIIDHELTTGPSIEARPPNDVASSVSAAVTLFFSGYGCSQPARRTLWPDVPLDTWLRSLDPFRDVVPASANQLASLVERCDADCNGCPAGILLPHVVRRLMRDDYTRAAARLCTLIPPVTQDGGDLEATLFSVADAIIGDIEGIPYETIRDLRTCLWIDRRLFALTSVYARLRDEASLDSDVACRQQQSLTDAVNRGLANRRPVLSPHHFRVGMPEAELMFAVPIKPDTVEVLCIPNQYGIQSICLTAIQVVLLNACDGRQLSQAARIVAGQLGSVVDEVEDALAALLLSLTRVSVLAVDWNR